jgi:hypothetical protein
MVCVTAAPQSPPWVTNRVYPRRFISTTQARATRTGSHPGALGLAENPWAGRDGFTRWNASDALAPYAVGLVSGSMILSCSMIDPGHSPRTAAQRSVDGDQRLRGRQVSSVM